MIDSMSTVHWGAVWGMDGLLICPLGAQEWEKETNKTGRSLSAANQTIQKRRLKFIRSKDNKTCTRLVAVDAACCMTYSKQTKLSVWWKSCVTSRHGACVCASVFRQSLLPQPFHLCNHGNTEQEVLLRMLCCSAGEELHWLTAPVPSTGHV